jgi:hypothetical protein
LVEAVNGMPAAGVIVAGIQEIGGLGTVLAGPEVRLTAGSGGGGVDLAHDLQVLDAAGVLDHGLRKPWAMYVIHIPYLMHN